MVSRNFVSQRNFHQFLEQPGVVVVVRLVVQSLRWDLVSLTVSLQLREFIQWSRVQGVSVDQTHQILSVMFLAEPRLSWSGLPSTRLVLDLPGVLLLHHPTLSISRFIRRLCVEGHVAFLEQLLQSGWLPVSEVEEAVAGVMCVEAIYVAHLSPAQRLVVRVVAAAAELVATLRAGEVHAATFGQSVLETAAWTCDAVVSQISGQAQSLIIWIVVPLPLLELFTGDILMLCLPRFFAFAAEALVTGGTGDFELVHVIDKARRAVAAPEELRVLHECVLCELFME